MGINTRQLRRLYESAVRDRKPKRFFDDLSEGFKSKEISPKEFSIRDLFENFVENGREIVDSWNPRHGGGGILLMEAGGAAVSTAAFSNISQQIVYSEILEGYQSETSRLVELIPTQQTQFDGEKIAGIDAIGDKAEIVEENGTYPHVGVGENWIETPSTTKRGLIVPVTKEAIFFDRTGNLLQRCSDVGGALGINRDKRATDCVIDENSTKHRYNWRGTSYATYQTSSPWINSKASNALVDWSDIDNVEALFDAMTDPGTGEPITITPKHLIVTRDNLRTAQRILTATSLRTVTPGYATSGAPTETEWRSPLDPYELIWSRRLKTRLATSTDFFVGDVSKAFRYMENWPLTVVPAPVNSEAEFERDVVQRYKASERGAYATMDPRFMAKSAA